MADGTARQAAPYRVGGGGGSPPQPFDRAQDGLKSWGMRGEESERVRRMALEFTLEGAVQDGGEEGVQRSGGLGLQLLMGHLRDDCLR